MEVLPAGAMAGAMGAYASSTGTIYLNQEWLMRASREQVLAVLTEELGHHLDTLLNTSDTPGDEGELFAAFLTGTGAISEARRQALLAENDQGSAWVGGRELAVERAAPLVSTPIRPASPGRSSGEFLNTSAFAVLKADGSVVTWGNPSSGGTSSAVANQLWAVSQIFSNTRAFAALKADGSVVTWGEPTYGGDSSTVASQLRSGVSQIFSTASAFAALKSDGSVVTWGVAGDSSAVTHQLSAGVSHIVSNDKAFAALKADGSVVTWGNSKYGGDSNAVTSHLRSGVSQIVSTGDILAGAFAALKTDGSVVTWGDPSSGGTSSAVANQLRSGVSQIVATESAFAALKSDGSVVTWGFGAYGGDSGAVASQLRSGVRQIVANNTAFAALKADGSVVTWGFGAYGGDSGVVASQLSSGVSQIVSNNNAFAAIKADGSVISWGDIYRGGNSSAVASQLRSGVSQVFATGSAFAALKADGSVVSWGDSSSGGNSSAVASQLRSGVSQVFATASAFAALKADGSVVSWGDPSSGGNSSGVASLLTNVVAFANPFADDRLIQASYTPGPLTVQGVNLGNTSHGYALVRGQAAPMQVTYPGGHASPSNPGNGWSAVAAAPSGNGFALYWRHSGSDQTARWDLNSTGAYSGGSLLSPLQLLSEEASLNVDLNGDGTTAGPTTVNGVNLGRNAQGYALVTAKLPPIQVTFPGGHASPDNPGNGWSAVAATTAASGYSLYWRHSGSGQTARWDLNSTGAYSGGSLLSPSQLLSEEASLKFDLNGDGTTAGPTTINGVNLGQNSQGYALLTGGAPPLQVTYPGGHASPNNPGNGWSAVAATTAASGYSLYWRHSGSGQAARWDLSSTGAYLGGTLLSASQLLSEESNLNIDLNGDGYTAGPTSLNGVNLGRTSQGYALVAGNAPPIQVSYYGLNASESSPGNGWAAVAATSSGGGFALYWRHSGSGETVRWQLNSGGTYQSGAQLSGFQLRNEEVAVNGDLNGDAIIGPAYTPIESQGNASLLRQGDGLAAVQVGDGLYPVTSPFGLGTGDLSSDWQMLAAETVGGQNQILWRNNPSNFYHIWTLNNSWSWQSSFGNISPNSAAALGLETNFQLDLNGNGLIG